MTEHDNVHHLHAELFSRDGHLTMLALDRFEVGELTTPMCETVIDHVEACETCAHRLASMRADAIPLQPPSRLRHGNEDGVGRSNFEGAIGTFAIAGTVAAAAALLVMAIPQPQQAERATADVERFSASPYTTTAELEGAVTFDPAFDLSVVEASSNARVEPGDRVLWDTPLTLHVSPHEAGYVAVVSAAERGVEEFADTDGGGAEHEVQVLMPVTRLEARSGPHALTVEHATRLAPDAADEKLIAIFCEEPFALDDPFDPNLPELGEDCTSVEVTLTRFGEITDS